MHVSILAFELLFEQVSQSNNPSKINDRQEGISAKRLHRIEFCKPCFP